MIEGETSCKNLNGLDGMYVIGIIVPSSQQYYSRVALV